jgi:hypothetical protein
MPAVTIANDNSSDAESREEGKHHPPEPSIWPVRASRPQRCRYCYQEDCVGCACLCVDSNEWFDHPGGHVNILHYFRDFTCIFAPKTREFGGRGGDLMGVMGEVGRGGKRRRHLCLMAATMD